MLTPQFGNLMFSYHLGSRWKEDARYSPQSVHETQPCVFHCVAEAKPMLIPDFKQNRTVQGPKGQIIELDWSSQAPCFA